LYSAGGQKLKVEIMELFEGVASVRLKSCCYGKYLCAKDERLVCQERDRNEKGTIWSVEKVASTGFNNDDNNSVRIKSVNGMYLTALEVALLLGDKGNKVQQTHSSKADSAVEWEPIQVGKHQLNLKTKRGTYLRANGGIPPYKNSVTHNGTKKDSTLNSFLWEVEVVEYLTDKLATVDNKGTSQVCWICHHFFSEIFACFYKLARDLLKSFMHM
jgi:hypothetical protein